MYHTEQSQTPCCITQSRVRLHAVSHRPESDFMLYHTEQSQTSGCITQNRVRLHAVSHRTESDTLLNHTTLCLPEEQRIYISKKTDVPLRLPNISPPSLSLLLYFNYLTVWQSRRGERLGGQMFGRRRGVLSGLLLIYILCWGVTLLWNKYLYCKININYMYKYWSYKMCFPLLQLFAVLHTKKNFLALTQV